MSETRNKRLKPYYPDPDEGLRFFRAFCLIEDPELREAAIQVVERLAEGRCGHQLLALLRSQSQPP
jgi:hypothetical protein